MRTLALAALALTYAGSAGAQDSGWTSEAAIYGWLAGINTTVETGSGVFEGETEFRDILSNLDMVFMGSYAAQRGRLGFVADLLYLDLSTSAQTPLPIFGDAEIGVSTTALSGYALYRVTDDPTVVLDIGGGFRAFDMGIDLAVGPGIAPGFAQEVSGNWVDPLIAARLAVPLSGDWTLTGFADWGTSGGDDETWQVFGSLKYDINDRWSTQIGYRYMEINKELEGRDFTVGLGGPVIAARFGF